MGRSSILGGERAPTQAEGRDTERLGPSDSSDSGSDVQGVEDMHGDSDAAGTGERGSALPDEGVESARDILPDHIETLAPDETALEADDDVSPRAIHRRSDELQGEDDDSEDA